MAQEDGNRGGLRLVRAAVSKKKTRYTEHGFDLDLTYITRQVVAMGFPSSGTEAMYRNPLPEVLKFFNFFHLDKYKVYNLCSEKQYPLNTFFLQSCFPHPDHNPPPFKTLVKFCEDARSFTDQDSNHVLAVHCKAGKGRTGTAIAAYLCMKECATAEEAMNIFGKARTSNNKGITIPSQQRFVMYYAAYVNQYVRIERPFFDFEDGYPIVKIKGFVLTHCPNVDVGGGCIPYFKIFIHGEKKPKYNMRKYQKLTVWKPKEIQREFRFSSSGSSISSNSSSSSSSSNSDGRNSSSNSGNGFTVRGDFKISFFDKDTMGRTKMFTCWLNTAFLRQESYIFTKFSLDGPHHDNKHKIFHPNFSMELLLYPFEGSTNEAVQDENNTPFIPERVTPTTTSPTSAKEESSEEEEEEDDDEEEGKRRPHSAMESYLQIKTQKKAGYKRYYFVLFASEIAYFDAIATKRPKETITLTTSATMGFVTDSETEFWVCPSTDGRVFDLQAKSTSVRRAWMEAIAAAILEIQRSRSRTRSPAASAYRRSVNEYDRSSRKSSRERDYDKSPREHEQSLRDYDKSPREIVQTQDRSLRDYDKSPRENMRDYDKSPRDYDKSPRAERGDIDKYPPERGSFFLSPLAKSPSFVAVSDTSYEDGDDGVAPVSPRNLAAPVSYSPRSLSTSTSSSPHSVAASESKSLLALRALIQSKQQALAKPETKTDESSSQVDIPVISLTPSESSVDSEAATPLTDMDSQVMEKLKQIQKLLAASSVT